jgi:curved DNA-binding protein CbpA
MGGGTLTAVPLSSIQGCRRFTHLLIGRLPGLREVVRHMPGPRPRRDHYAVLGVEPTASARQITSAYRKLVRRLHPDTGSEQPTAREELAKVVEAYNTLRDPQRRRDYDTTLRDLRTPSPSEHPIPVRVTRAGGSQPPRLVPNSQPGSQGLTGLPLRAGPVRIEQSAHHTGTASADLLEQFLRWMWDVGPWL